MHAILFLGAILVLAWDERLTEQLLGEQNRRAAEAAAAADELNWTEVGVGVGADGSPYLQQISRGQASRHIRAGLLLVATDEVRGEIFEKSVVLVVRHDENGTLGLVLNKPAPLPRGFSSREEAPRVRVRREASQPSQHKAPRCRHKETARSKHRQGEMGWARPQNESAPERAALSHARTDANMARAQPTVQGFEQRAVATGAAVKSGWGLSPHTSLCRSGRAPVTRDSAQRRAPVTRDSAQRMTLLPAVHSSRAPWTFKALAVCCERPCVKRAQECCSEDHP